MRHLSLILFTFLCLSGFAQTLQSGDKLTYNVKFEGESYNFSAKVKQFAPEMIFDFTMTGSPGICGTVKMDKKATESAVKMYNNFSPDETQIILKDAISVFPSKGMTDALYTEKSIRMDAGNGMMTYSPGESKKMNVIYYASQAGKVISSDKIIEAKSFVSENGKNFIWITRDFGQPVIVEMDLGWTIQIATYSENLPLSESPQDLLGKSVLSEELKPLWLRIKDQSLIQTEDLSDPDKPYVDKEYFCPMEGIRMETHNDTLTQLLFYTEGYEHEGLLWRGYEGKFSSGFHLGMTYAEVDNKIGKPSTPRWPTDVLIQYPQQKLTVYYDMPANEKDKKAIAKAKINFIEFGN